MLEQTDKEKKKKEKKKIVSKKGRLQILCATHQKQSHFDCFIELKGIRSGNNNNIRKNVEMVTNDTNYSSTRCTRINNEAKQC